MYVITEWVALTSVAQIDAALEGLTLVNEVQIREAIARGNPLPSLYESGVRYRMEKLGRERWQTIEHALRTRFADCEDLAAWRAAELRSKGMKAVARCYQPRPGLVHCVCYVVSGGREVKEDPSKRLGMGVV